MVAFEVLVVDGEGLPVPGVEVGARYQYSQNAQAWSTGITDGDGRAGFKDQHPEAPGGVSLFVGSEACGIYKVDDGCSVTVEV